MNSLNRFSCKSLFVCWALILLLPLSTIANAKVDEAGTDSGQQQMIAKVNGKPIYEDQLSSKIKQQLANFQKFDNTQFSDEYRKQLQMDVLDEVIRSEIVYQESLKSTIPGIEEKIARQVENLKNHPMGQYKHKNDSQLKDIARRQVYVGHYFTTNNLLNPEVPEAEIKSYYEKNKQYFAAKEASVHVRHVLVQIDQNADSKVQEAALKKIEKARKLIVDGKDFADVAKEFSEDNAASGGGDIGYVKQGYMPPEFEAVAFTLKPGTLSDIVKTKFGFHILEVIDVVHKGQIAPYSDLKDFFGKFLREQNTKRVVDNHLQELRKKAKIEFFLE